MKPDKTTITIENWAKALHFNDRLFTALVDTNNQAYVLPSDLLPAFNAFLAENDITKTLEGFTLNSDQLNLEKLPHVPFDLCAELSDVSEAFKLDVNFITSFNGENSSWTAKRFLEKPADKLPPAPGPRPF